MVHLLRSLICYVDISRHVRVPILSPLLLICNPYKFFIYLSPVRFLSMYVCMYILLFVRASLLVSKCIALLYRYVLAINWLLILYGTCDLFVGVTKQLTCMSSPCIQHSRQYGLQNRFLAPHTCLLLSNSQMYIHVLHHVSYSTVMPCNHIFIHISILVHLFMYVYMYNAIYLNVCVSVTVSVGIVLVMKEQELLLMV